MIDWILAAAASIAVLFMLFYPKRKRNSEFLETHDRLDFDLAAVESRELYPMVSDLDAFLVSAGFDRLALFRDRGSSSYLISYVNRNYSLYFDVTLGAEEFDICLMTGFMSGMTVMSSTRPLAAGVLSTGWVLFSPIAGEEIEKMADAPPESRRGAIKQILDSHMAKVFETAQKGDRPSYCNLQNYTDLKDFLVLAGELSIP